MQFSHSVYPPNTINITNLKHSSLLRGTKKTSNDLFSMQERRAKGSRQSGRQSDSQWVCSRQTDRQTPLRYLPRLDDARRCYCLLYGTFFGNIIMFCYYSLPVYHAHFINLIIWERIDTVLVNKRIREVVVYASSLFTTLLYIFTTTTYNYIEDVVL